MALIAAHNLKKSFGTRTLFEDVTFELAPKEHAGLVGVNGCGKTTLFRILAGQESPDAGQVALNREAKISYMEQMELDLDRSLYGSALDAFAHLMEMELQLEEVNRKLTEGEGDLDALIRRQHSLQTRYEDGGGLTYRSRTRATLLGLGFTEAELEQPLSTMSGGQRSKAQLARVLLSGANLLLLDEPTNHLDIDSVNYLEDFLSSYPGAFIVISHDRYFLDKVTNRTLELENRRIESTNGNYSRHLELKASEREVALRHYQRTQREIRRIYGIVEQQRRWGQAHNFITAESKLKQAERLKATLVEPERDPESIRFHFTAREPGGNDVLMGENLKKSYGEKHLFHDVDLLIKKNERVFLLGPNGCGKTTLLRILTGREEPDAGTHRLGAKVQPAYYDQNISQMDPENTALQEVWDAYPRMRHTEVRNALATFLFKGDEVEKKIATLSGGEKARIQLLKMMLSGANLLLLDEPTNHLDIHSREA
ncbi:MAG: ABC-F family ATP-binding cassette domain-containing protein, partial [Clostridia bacterium]|nr:ABC-F family ATP-binding cassette domain-containing protein [Clostridia bacterium]